MTLLRSLIHTPSSGAISQSARQPARPGVTIQQWGGMKTNASSLATAIKIRILTNCARIIQQLSERKGVLSASWARWAAPKDEGPFKAPLLSRLPARGRGRGI